MFCRQAVRVFVGVALVAALAKANTVFAQFNPAPSGQVLESGGTSANREYKITYAQGTVAYNATDPVDTNQQGTLKITDTWMNMDCGVHTYSFMQNAVPGGDFGVGGGLRLQMELIITNQSGKPWSGFWVKLVNDNVPAGTEDSQDHLAHAHFHPNSIANLTPPPNRISTQTVTGETGFKAPTFAEVNNLTMFLIRGGRHENGKTFNTMNFFLHERNGRDGMNTPVTRSFDLVLMPHCVPEPSSGLLVMMGCVGVASTWRYSRKRKRVI